MGAHPIVKYDLEQKEEVAHCREIVAYEEVLVTGTTEYKLLKSRG